MNINTIEFVWLVLEAVDMRLGIDGLSSRVVQYLGKSPCDGHAYAFTNRSRNRLKLVVWDGNGVWLGQDPIIVFDYQTSRAGHHAREFLQDWQMASGGG